MGLLDKINKQRKADKKIDTKVVTEISYPTGFLPLDYANGIRVTSYDDNDRPVSTADLIGITGGCMTTIIGISGTGKSAVGIEIAASGIHQFGDNSAVQHADIERATTMARVMKATKLPPSILKNTYEIYQDMAAEDIVDQFKTHCMIKLDNRKEFTYETGVKNLYNEPISELYPSNLLMDSFAMFKSNKLDMADKKVEDITNNMVAATSAKFNKGVLSQMIAYGKKSNTGIVCINHINQDVNTGFLPKAAQHMYLNQGESLPGGTTSMYLANNLIKLKLLKKYNAEKPETMEYGIPGFIVESRFLKSRTNAANRPIELIFDHRRGSFSKLLTLFHYAAKQELLLGSNRAYYLPGLESIKFTKKTFEQQAMRSSEVIQALYEACLPNLESMLSTDFAGPKQESEKDKVDAMMSALEDHHRDMEDYKKLGWTDF